jgi:hypothetical protein
VVAPDAVLVEAGPVFFLVKVIGLSQLREEPALAGGQRQAGAQFLHRRAEVPRRVPRDAAEDLLPLVAQVRAEKREELDHYLVGNLARGLRAFAVPGARIADLGGEEAAVPVHVPALFLDLLG